MPDIVTHSFERALPDAVWSVFSLVDGRHVIVDRPVEVGRSSSCQLSFDDRSASRVHLRIEPDGTLIDLGSRNGTFVDGYRRTRIEVTQPAIVRVGDSVLCIAREMRTGGGRAPLVGLGAIHEAIARVAPSDLPILISGETGTGKNVVARMIHDASGRSGPFVTVSCVDGEPFDLDRAAGGTLFLDEIGELPPAAQAKLLHVLETTSRPVRIIAATNRSLRADFRPDLHARLAGVELRLPPLRERIVDLVPLVHYLWERAHTRSVTITADALEALAMYAWPHNVRELDHVLRAASLVDRDTLTLDALPEAIRARLLEARRASAIVPRIVHADRRSEIEAVLRDNRGNVRRAAHALGIARGHLYRLLARWEVDPASFRYR